MTSWIGSDISSGGWEPCLSEARPLYCSGRAKRVGPAERGNIRTGSALWKRQLLRALINNSWQQYPL